MAELSTPDSANAMRIFLIGGFGIEELNGKRCCLSCVKLDTKATTEISLFPGNFPASFVFNASWRLATIAVKHRDTITANQINSDC